MRSAAPPDSIGLSNRVIGDRLDHNAPVDGHLQSRAMATQKRVEDANVQFVLPGQHGKSHELSADPHINYPATRPNARD